MVVAPHHLAAEAGLEILRGGGNAIEAMIAAAAAICVAYPHMNGLGGDNFWLIHMPGSQPIAIQACGPAASLATTNWYRDRQQSSIPPRGPLAALTAAGAVSGWSSAYKLSARMLRGRFPLDALISPAIRLAREGIAVTTSQARNTASKWHQLHEVSGFVSTFAPSGRPPELGERFSQPRLASTLEHLVRSGFDDFYRGDLARSIARDLEAAGSPLRLADLEKHHAAFVEPLSLGVDGHTVYNLPPPTQGLASLLLLDLYGRVRAERAESFDHVHRLVEATKLAFAVRNRFVTDPGFMATPAASLLAPRFREELASKLSLERASPWPEVMQSGGDTVYLAASDRNGCSVSFIQSIYWEFGSGLVLPATGIVWQNRGTSFSLEPGHHNRLLPSRLPFHTIQPAMACLSDGRVVSYGTMGGEGQPQTQAAIFTRHVLYNQDLQASITAPRWLLGRTWGDETTSLKIESRFDDGLIKKLMAAGHQIERLGPYDEVVGHAGAISRHRDGLLEGACDPRSDGAAVAL